MINFKIIAIVSGHAKGQQILAALKAHLLFESDLLHLARFHAVQERLLGHGVGTGDLRPPCILEGYRKDRCRNVIVYFYFHMDGKLGAFDNSGRTDTVLICHIALYDLGLSGTVLLGIWVDGVCHFALGTALLAVFTVLLVLSHQHALKGIDHLLGTSLT